MDVERSSELLTGIKPDVQSVIIQWPDATSGGLEGISSDKVPT